MEIKINPNLIDLPTLDYRAMEDVQGELKILDKENYERLRNTLVEQGQLAPFFIWIDPGTDKRMIVDGHQRKRLFTLEKVTPVERPYILIPGANINEAKKALLAISSQYGRITQEGFDKFTFDFPKDWLNENIHFDELSKAFADQEKENKKLVQFNASEPEYVAKHEVVVECKDEADQQIIYNLITEKGYKCRILTL